MLCVWDRRILESAEALDMGSMLSGSEDLLRLSGLWIHISILTGYNGVVVGTIIIKKMPFSLFMKNQI